MLKSPQTHTAVMQLFTLSEPAVCPEYHRLSSSTWKREHSKHLHCLWIVCWRSSAVPEKSNFSVDFADLCFLRPISSALRLHQTRTEPPADASASRSGAPASARLRPALSCSNQLRSSSERRQALLIAADEAADAQMRTVCFFFFLKTGDLRHRRKRSLLSRGFFFFFFFSC